MLDKPDFVGSYDVGEYVYFFFREMAVEYMNCGKTVYSRVARVCKRDTGGKNVLNQVPIPRHEILQPPTQALIVG
jgi:hypothetical protein